MYKHNTDQYSVTQTNAKLVPYTSVNACTDATMHIARNQRIVEQTRGETLAQVVNYLQRMRMNTYFYIATLTA